MPGFLLLSHLVHSPAQPGHSALGIVPVNDSFAGCLIQNRIRSLQSRPGLILIIGLHSAAYCLDCILHMALDHPVPGASFQTLTMTLQGLLCICQAA
jgi:hypothetical protein